MQWLSGYEEAAPQGVGVYIGMFLLLGVLGAGCILGLDAPIEKLPFVGRIGGAEHFLG